jgi:uncharacterized membrane protein YtjA (UPF0391 family)
LYLSSSLKFPTSIVVWGNIRSDHALGAQSIIRSNIMGNLLHYAIVFLIVALVAAFLGFGGVAGTAMDGARILFWVAIVLFVISLIGGLVRRT